MAEETWKYYWSRSEVAETFGCGENFSPTCSKVSGEELPISRRIPDSTMLLDAGCGPGRYVHYLHSRVKTYICADLSREMLDVAKKRNRYENVYFVRCDLEYLPFPSRLFDTVLCVSVLRHLPYIKAEKVFKSLLNATKNRFFFTAYFSESLGVVGNPSILDHSYGSEVSRWANPLEVKRITKLTNEQSERYLMCVENE